MPVTAATLIPLVNAGVDLTVKLIAAIRSLPETDDAMKRRLEDIEKRLDETVAAVKKYKPREV